MKKIFFSLGLCALIFWSCNCYTGLLNYYIKFYDGNILPDNQIARLRIDTDLLAIESMNGTTIEELSQYYNNKSGRKIDVFGILQILPGTYTVGIKGENPIRVPGSPYINRSISGHWILEFKAEAGKQYSVGYDEVEQTKGGILSSNKEYSVTVWIKDFKTKKIVSEIVK